MNETPQVGQTWLSPGGNLYRIVSIRAGRIVVDCIGIIDAHGREWARPPARLSVISTKFDNPLWRIVAHTPKEFDEYLKSLNKPESGEETR